eukprot:522078_1
MGVKNFLLVFTAIPIFYVTAFTIILYEKAQGWMGPIQMELMYRFGVSAEKYPIMILLLSTALCYGAFWISTYAAALFREDDWDNSTTRNVPEKQVGFSYRASCAHLNEGEQFRYISVAVIIALIVMNTESVTERFRRGDDIRLTVDFINYCCTGYIVHRALFHIMFIFNVSHARSLCFCISFCYILMLFLSSIYGIQAMNQLMDAKTPELFHQWDIARMSHAIADYFGNPY